MVDWQVTATTIYCDAVDDEVTLMVYKDWSIKCTGYGKYGENNNGGSSLSKKGRSKRQVECGGPECWRVTQYKEKLSAEEARKGHSE